MTQLQCANLKDERWRYRANGERCQRIKLHFGQPTADLGDTARSRELDIGNPVTPPTGNAGLAVFTVKIGWLNPNE
jgi:hypothetical protein